MKARGNKRGDMPLNPVRTVYAVVNSYFGKDTPTHDAGGFPHLFSKIDKAKAFLRKTVKGWVYDNLKRGENDGDKWADRRYDSDGTVAWCDEDGATHKSEVIDLEIDIRDILTDNELWAIRHMGQQLANASALKEIRRIVNSETDALCADAMVAEVQTVVNRLKSI